jgi:hypothetical protein
VLPDFLFLPRSYATANTTIVHPDIKVKHYTYGYSVATLLNPRGVTSFPQVQSKSCKTYNCGKKGKAIPLHAMEAFGGRGGIDPTHSRPRH